MKSISTEYIGNIGSPPVISGVTDVVSAIIDLATCDASSWTLDLGVVGAGNTAYVEESSDPAMANAVKIGTINNIVAIPVVSNRLVIISLIQPLKRYQRLTLKRPNATVVNAIHCYARSKFKPVTQLASQVSATARLIQGG